MTAILEPISVARAPSAGVPPSPRNGDGAIELERVNGQTRVVRSVYRQPLKLLTPRSGGAVASIYATTFGGGLVAGDRIDLTLTAGDRTSAFLSSQSATKVYRAARGRTGCGQTLHATLGDGALLVVWPDPVICFDAASYVQDQTFELCATASLALVDWQTSGRLARGERWAFRRYLSRNRIAVAGRPIVNDVLLLDQEDGPIDAPFRAGRFDCLATVIVLGPALGADVAAITNQARAAPAQRGGRTLVTASPVAGGVIVRILGPDAHHVGRLIRSLLSPVTARLGEDPWSRKW